MDVLFNTIGQSIINVYEANLLGCNGDTATIVVNVVEPTPINYFYNSNSFIISPNPIINQAIITFQNSSYQTYRLELNDVSGKLVREYNSIITDKFILSTNGLSKGVYIISLIGPKSRFNKRVIIE